ncbi:MAG: peptide ABC transporter substrate-binding protein [Actinomycetota bacterium]
MIAAVLLSGCDPLQDQADETPAAEGGGTLRFGVAGLRSLETSSGRGTALVLLKAACDGLVSLDPDGGEPKPALAESWTISRDARKVRLTIRQGVLFHDGTEVDAAAVADSLSRITQPATESLWGYLLGDVEGFSKVQAGTASRLSGIAVDEPNELTITLSSPHADFISLLAHPSLVPTSRGAEKDDDDEVDPGCAGPYRIEGRRESLRLERDDEYRGANEAYARRGSGFLDHISIVEFETGNEALEGLLEGKVQLAAVPASRAGEPLPGETGHARRATQEVTYLALGLSGSASDDSRIRQSISLAVNRFVIIDAAFGDERQPAIGWLPGFPGPSEVSDCAEFAGRIDDPRQAKRVFARTGADPRQITLPLRFDPDRTSGLVANSLVVQVKDILGITLQPTPVDAAELESSIREESARGMWMFTAEPDVPVLGRTMSRLFGRGSSENLTGFRSRRFERSLSRARAELDPDTRAERMLDAESTVCGQMPAIPLWTGARHWRYDPESVLFEGPDVDLWGDVILRNTRVQ